MVSKLLPSDYHGVYPICCWYIARVFLWEVNQITMRSDYLSTCVWHSTFSTTYYVTGFGKIATICM